MSTVIPAPEPVTLPVAGTDTRFPVRRVFCVGRNYAEHSIEMGHDPDREPPFFFMKPADAMIPCGDDAPGTHIAYPPRTEELHHEVELVVAIGDTAVDVPVERATEAIWGYGVAIDLTRRDLQAEAKAMRRPWDLSKGFDESGPVSALRPAAEIGHPDHGRIQIEVDGEVKQEGDLSQQIWSVPEIIAELSRYVALRPGDLVLTGTPSGVGPVPRGARLVASVEGVAELRCTID
jgi:fumarylpyruvate hydrolase